METGIRVRAYDYTGLPPAALDQKRLGDGQHGRGGEMRLEWIVCRHVVQRIVWETAGQPSGELGLTRANDRDASLTVVSRIVAEKMAGAGVATRDQILAYGAVHELGHAILGAKCHSRTGVMKAVVHRRGLSR